MRRPARRGLSFVGWWSLRRVNGYCLRGVVVRVLGGGGNAPLTVDQHWKTFSYLVLGMEILEASAKARLKAGGG